MDPYLVRRNIMAEEYIESVTVVDVYDQAAGIGKEFEKLIESYGVDSVTDLMPKVIKALEQLETLAGKYEKENAEIADLKFSIDKLESEKVERIQERLRYEQELEQIEENWQKEAKELYSVIGQLQEDNRRLRDNLSETKEAVKEEVAAVTRQTEEKEIEVLTKLKVTVDKQREELRKLKRESKQKEIDCEALQSQLEQVVKVNTELRRKNSTHKKHSQTLISERADLEAQLADKEQQITHITEFLKDQEIREAESKSNTQTEHLQNQVEEDDSHEHEEKVSSELVAADGVTEPEVVESGEGENMADIEADIEAKMSMVGKMVIDMKDPNRPRFTLNELRTVLFERNELKAKLMEVEEELSAYKPKPEKLKLENPASDSESNDLDYSGEEDLPVQGPVNKEPFEKLYPGMKRESGIRKFFKFVFGPSPSKDEYPRRRSRDK